MSTNTPRLSSFSIELVKVGAPSPFSAWLSESSSDDCDVLILEGDLCTVSAAKASPAILRWLDRTTSRCIEVDLEKLRFLDGRGVTLLVELLGRGNEDGRSLLLCGPGPEVERVLDICGLPYLRSDTAPDSLYVLSHRLPIVLDCSETWTMAPGGLVSALKPSLTGRDALWFGHCRKGEAPDGAATNNVRIAPLVVGPNDWRNAIDGYSNRTLWPALHGLMTNVEQDPAWWQSYENRNAKTAQIIANEAHDGATIWIHDYHHYAVAHTLRRLRPDLRLGLFCHTPVDFDGLASVLERVPLAERLRAHDLIGTQTERDAISLRAFIDEFAPGEPVRISAVPVGVDVELWESYKSNDDVAELTAEYAPHHGHLAVGIDRADYTKGIPHRLLAVEILLDTEMIKPDEFRLVQIAVPSRTSIPIYKFLSREIAGIADRINSRHRRADGKPVVELITSQQTPTRIASLMRAADSALITPLRDGMNVVAVEFSIVNADRPTDLILGSGAGIVDHLGSWAHVVDGSDVLAIASQIEEIVRNPKSDRLEQSKARAAAAREFTAERWAYEFLSMLETAAPEAAHLADHSVTLP